MNSQESSLMGILNGRDSIKFEVSVDVVSVGLIAAAVFVVGIALIAISKSWKLN